MRTRAEVVEEARSWIDTPYVHQHREKGHAVDCAGLLIGVARNLGVVAADFDVNGYARSPDGASLMAECDKWMTRVALQDLKPGHALVLRFGEDPQHIGIVADYSHGGNSLIHSYSAARPFGRVVEHRLMQTKSMTPVQGYSLPGVED